MPPNTGVPDIDNAVATTIVGSDECGYGAWAGPLVVCAVAVPCAWEDPGLVEDSPVLLAEGRTYKDSKRLKTRKRREEVFRLYHDACPDWMVISPVVVEAATIDEVGVWDALRDAHRRAVLGTYYRLAHSPIVVVDGNINPIIRDTPQVFSVPKADVKVAAVSLASIIAKVLHDRIMDEMDKAHPGYGFDTNAGYHSPKHVAGLNELGPCPIHRRSYAPVAKADPSNKLLWKILSEG